MAARSRFSCRPVASQPGGNEEEHEAECPAVPLPGGNEGVTHMTLTARLLCGLAALGACSDASGPDSRAPLSAALVSQSIVQPKGGR
jgi:hypothetical protein